MNPNTTASVICPACGQPFLCMQQSMEGVAQCPHCAHSGPRAHFGTQIQVMGVAPGRRQVSQTQPLPVAAPVFQQPVHAAPPAPQPAAWQGYQAAPTTSIARPALQFSQALMPTGEPPPPAEFVTPQSLQGNPWRNAVLMLGFMAVCGAGIGLWWDQANTSAATPKTAATPPVEPAPKAPLPAAVKVPAPQMEMPDTDAYAADAKTLVTEFFTADTPERRAACVHDAARHEEEIEALFGAGAAEKIELRVLARIPGLPLTLPGGRWVPLFRLITSKCAAGALVRLETGTDGKRRLHWPLLAETHEGRLAAFLKNGTGEEAAWFHVALRPSHGLDIPAELRPKYLTFDVQAAATSDPHLVACVGRDTPLGRFMDRESDWGKVYLCRLLVRRLEIASDAPCMIVVDCEGSPER